MDNETFNYNIQRKKIKPLENMKLKCPICGDWLVNCLGDVNAPEEARSFNKLLD